MSRSAATPSDRSRRRHFADFSFAERAPCRGERRSWSNTGQARGRRDLDQRIELADARRQHHPRGTSRPCSWPARLFVIFDSDGPEPRQRHDAPRTRPEPGPGGSYASRSYVRSPRTRSWLCERSTRRARDPKREHVVERPALRAASLRPERPLAGRRATSIVDPEVRPTVAAGDFRTCDLRFALCRCRGPEYVAGPTDRRTRTVTDRLVDGDGDGVAVIRTSARSRWRPINAARYGSVNRPSPRRSSRTCLFVNDQPRRRASGSSTIPVPTLSIEVDDGPFRPPGPTPRRRPSFSMRGLPSRIVDSLVSSNSLAASASCASTSRS